MILCLGVLSACKSRQEPGSTAAVAEPIDMVQVAEGQYGGIREAQTRRIRSLADWETCWSELHEGTLPIPERPVVDFDSRELLACFMGERSSGGYRLSIPGVARQGDTLMIRVVHIEPGKRCLTTMALTQPYQVVAIPRQDASAWETLVETQVQPCE